MSDSAVNAKMLLLSIAAILLSTGAAKLGTEQWVEAIIYIILGVFILALREQRKKGKKLTTAKGGQDGRDGSD